MRYTFLIFSFLFFVFGCGVHDSSSVTDTPVSPEAQKSAAEYTAKNNSKCTALGDYYWEIGTSKEIVVSGGVGSSYTRDTTVSIASASKWIFAAYVAEKYGPTIPDAYGSYLRMMSGYTNFEKSAVCSSGETVLGCLNTNKIALSQGDYGSFFYNDGHMQKLASILLPNHTASQLDTEVFTTLGLSDMYYTSTRVAGAIKATAAAYSTFLIKIITAQLKISSSLGANSVCTLKTVCKKASYSPKSENWKYSFGHWFEDTTSYEGFAYSSQGLFGFYPWIDSTKTYYGIISRDSTDSGASEASANCGREIRAAFLSGKKRQ